MAAVHIAAFVSSDLKRAYDTCRIIAAPHGMDILTTPLLRERDWGGFTGRYIPDLKNAEWPDDIETLDALRARRQVSGLYKERVSVGGGAGRGARNNQQGRAVGVFRQADG